MSFSHNNTINKSSSSEDKVEANPNLQVITEEEASDPNSNESDNNSDNELENIKNTEMTEEQPVTPSQLSALPTFDGEHGEGFVNLLEQLEVAQVHYNWSVNSLVQVAEAKGGIKVADWDNGNHLRGQVRD